MSQNQAADGRVSLELEERGSGQNLLFLHGWAGSERNEQFIEQLACNFAVIAPTHPGFKGSPRPKWLNTIDDLAYLYLDLLAERDLRDVVVVGVSLGGWIAAEMTVRSAERLASLVLVDAVGIRAGGREDRDIADIYALSREEVHARLYHDPSAVPVGFDGWAAEDVQSALVGEETTALLVWKPYMHNPKLRQRLARISIPTLVAWGESDGIVDASYGRAYAESIAGARFELIAAAGHAPDVEQPERLADLITRFVEEAKEITA